MEADTHAWRTEADQVLGYFTERLVLDRDSHVMGTDLLADFNHWAESRGLRAWGDQTLSERFGSHGNVTAAGVQRGRLSNGLGLSRPSRIHLVNAAPTRFRGWAGVRFRTDADDAKDDLRAPVDGADRVLRNFSHEGRSVSHPGPPSTPSTAVKAQARGAAAADLTNEQWRDEWAAS